MRSIEVLGCMVASALPRNNPYLGQAYRYRMTVALPHRTTRLANGVPTRTPVYTCAARSVPSWAAATTSGSSAASSWGSPR